MHADHPPPLYSPADLSPAYSPYPKVTERTLQRSSAAGPSRISPTGYFIRRNDDITLLLHGQDDDAQRPYIGPGALLEGSIILERTDRENVRAVELSIDGFLESRPLPGAHLVATVISISTPLYSANDSCCPNNLPFSHRFPSIFSYEGATYLLPPTCHIQFNYSELFAKCTYRITAKVLIRHPKPPFLRKEHRISVELDYHPQPVPSDPILENPSLFSTVKLCPEEWTQLPMTAAAADTAGPKELVCDLFVPSARIFCISDVIPFHLHVSGPVALMREMFQPVPRAFTHPFPSAGDFAVQVCIIRRITMRVGDKSARRSIVLGQGTLRPLPPAFRAGANNEAEALNWEGETCCTDPGTVGTFEGGLFTVKDSLAAEVSPPPGSSLRRAFAEYPIKLTASGWIT
ncbi:hypothetical protein FB451DRAFT_1306843 [Mycena latifolia]|nr:hypothetical protein FB451DRAFT_1306843 [Mycena latifolia]